VPGKPLRAFDISWVDAVSARYYLADRSNASIDVFDTITNSIVTQIGGFKGATGKNDTSGLRPEGQYCRRHQQRRRTAICDADLCEHPHGAEDDPAKRRDERRRAAGV
jgi:hypothetical protein